MDGLETINMTQDLYVKSIIPIGILFSGSLILSNMAYLSLSVSFIQMLKVHSDTRDVLQRNLTTPPQAFTPVAILLISATFKLQSLNQKLILIVVLISTGCALGKSYGYPLSPLLNLTLSQLRTERYTSRCLDSSANQLQSSIGPLVLMSNAAVAFGLNVAAVFLIGAAGGLVLTLAGVFKDILLISASCLFFGSAITPIQIFGYALALSGLVAYKTASSK
ncbi:hypothetical protein P7C73_g2903, partial [Tremellales sp. Uapishka_1]